MWARKTKLIANAIPFTKHCVCVCSRPSVCIWSIFRVYSFQWVTPLSVDLHSNIVSIRIHGCSFGVHSSTEVQSRRRSHRAMPDQCAQVKCLIFNALNFTGDSLQRFRATVSSSYFTFSPSIFSTDQQMHSTHVTPGPHCCYSQWNGPLNEQNGWQMDIGLRFFGCHYIYRLPISASIIILWFAFAGESINTYVQKQTASAKLLRSVCQKNNDTTPLIYDSGANLCVYLLFFSFRSSFCVFPMPYHFHVFTVTPSIRRSERNLA